MTSKRLFANSMLDRLPWQVGYSHILGRNEEFIWNAPSVPEARELLNMLQSKLKGTTLDEFVTFGRHKYMLVHRMIVRVRC
jgi:hypothetical protein